MEVTAPVDLTQRRAWSILPAILVVSWTITLMNQANVIGAFRDSIPGIVGLIGILVSLAGLIVIDPSRLRRVRVPFAVFLLLALGIASGAWSVVPTESIFAIRSKLIPLVLLMILIGALDRRLVLRVLNSGAQLMLASNLLCVMFFTASRTGNYVDSSGLVDGWRGAFVHKNQLAIFSSLCICVVLAVEESRVRRRAMVAIGVLLVLGSRSGTGFGTLSVIPLFQMLRFLMLERDPRRRGVRLVSFLGLLLFGGAGGALALPTVLGFMGKDTTLSGRLDIWRIGFEFAMRRPFFGWGVSGIWVVYDKDPTYSLNRQLGFDSAHAHNGPLGAFAELGIVGLGLVLIGIATVIIVGFRLINRDQFKDGYLLIGLGLTLLVSSVSESMMTSGPGWFVLGVASALAFHQDLGPLSQRLPVGQRLEDNFAR